MRNISELHKEIRTRALPNSQMILYSDVYDYYTALVQHVNEQGRLRPDEKIYKEKFEIAFSTRISTVFIDPSADLWHAHHSLILLDLWAQLPISETV